MSPEHQYIHLSMPDVSPHARMVGKSHVQTSIVLNSGTSISSQTIVIELSKAQAVRTGVAYSTPSLGEISVELEDNPLFYIDAEGQTVY